MAEQPQPTEQTFRSYTAQQSTHYAQYRRGFPPELYDHVLDHHTSTGGELDTVVDVGCGPGQATRSLAHKFNHAIGLDASPSMIEAARELGGSTAASEKIQYGLSSAEHLGSDMAEPIAAGTVDLIVASSAAHWFDMNRFWPRAAQVLKPGGSVIFWNRIAPGVHPSTPNYEAVQKAYEDWVKTYLIAYYAPGNFSETNSYKDLLLPWAIKSPVSGFDQDAYRRDIWQLSSSDNGMPMHGAAMDMPTMEKVLSTMSPVTRWREAHPDQVGTEGDVVRVLRRKVEGLLHEAGVDEGKGTITEETPKVVVVVVKKTSS